MKGLNGNPNKADHLTRVGGNDSGNAAHTTDINTAGIKNAALTYINAGLALVPLSPGEKGTNRTGWNLRENAICTVKQVHKLLTSFDNIGLAHAYCEPPTCAIDVDDLERARLWLSQRGIDLDALLNDPTAVRIHSRPGKAKLLYRLPRLMRTRVIKTENKKDTILEFRCASEEGKTMQDVLPPSIHPGTGEPYRLTGDINNIQLIPDALLTIWEQEIADCEKNHNHECNFNLNAVNETALTARLETVKIDPELAKLLNGETLPWMKDTSTSGFDFAFAKRLAILGFHDNEIAALLLQYPYGKIYGRKVGDAEKDITRSLGKVHDKLGETNGGAADIPVSPAIHLCTDLANANRLKQAAGGNIMYSAGQWHIWNSSHWEANEDAVYRQTFCLSALIKAEADEFENKPTDSEDERKHNREIAESLRKWGIKSEDERQLNAAFRLLRRQVGVPANTLDADPYLLNMLNGTFDLRTGRLRDHDKNDRITKLIPITYHPEAQAPLFEKALAEITGEAGFEHKPIVKALQRWFGYCATGLTTEQVFVVHWGSGANGKSLLLGTVERVLGPYAGAAAPGLLMSGTNNRHPTELADLRGKRVMTAYESGESGRLNEEFIKQATGSDRIKARFMRQDFFEFDPTHKLQLVTNHKPQIVGQDHAIWRRVLLFPYNIRFGTQAEMDKGEAHHVKNTVLAEALKDEDEGILAWIVKGAVMWYMAGLQPPDSVLAAGAAYREEQDRVGQFIDECCERQEGAKVSLKQLYLMYVQWTKNNGYTPLGRNKFADSVEGRLGISAKEQENFKYLGRACKGKVFTGMKYTGLGL